MLKFINIQISEDNFIYIIRSCPNWFMCWYFWKSQM